MKPINTKERNSLYLKFLGLYLVSIILVVLAVYFYSASGTAAADELKKYRDRKSVV